MALRSVLVSFSFLVPVETEPYTLSLHAALPIWAGPSALWLGLPAQHRRHERLPRARRRARGSLSCRRCCAGSPSHKALGPAQIGRAACRERVYGSVSTGTRNEKLTSTLLSAISTP